MASSIITCALRRDLCRLFSISSAFGLQLFAMKRFMDLDASSPRIAERIVSIRELSQEDNPAGVI